MWRLWSPRASSKYTDSQLIQPSDEDDIVFIARRSDPLRPGTVLPEAEPFTAHSSLYEATLDKESWVSARLVFDPSLTVATRRVGA
jgi:hypothetical protein